MQSGARVRFGTGFEFDLQTLELWADGQRVKLAPKPAKVLAQLLSSAGSMVSREAFRDGLWGADTFVDFEHGLNFCIKKIREALGDDAKNPKLIETLPRRGYRFIATVEAAPVRTVSSEAAQILAYEHYLKARKAFGQQGKAALDEARDEFEHALALNPDYAMAHSGLGATMALRMLNRRDPAELEIALRHLRRAVELDPDLGEPYPWLCYTHMRRSETALAIEAGRTGVALLPDLAQAHYFLALAYFVTCEEGAEGYQFAIDHLLRALQVGPNWHPSLFVISYAALLNGAYDAAVSFASRLVEKSKLPGLPFLGAEIVLGSTLFRQGKRAEARQVLKEFVEQLTQNGHMYRDAMTAIGDCVLGELEIREANFEAALSVFRRAWHTLQEHPRINAHRRISARVQAGMATAHSALGRRDQAAAALAKASDLLASSIPVGFAAAAASLPELYLSIAAAEVRAGEPAKAAESVRRAFEAGWRDSRWLLHDPELVSLGEYASFRDVVAEIEKAPRVCFEPPIAASG